MVPLKFFFSNKKLINARPNEPVPPVRRIVVLLRSDIGKDCIIWYT